MLIISYSETADCVHYRCTAFSHLNLVYGYLLTLLSSYFYRKSHEGYTSDHLYDLSDFVWQPEAHYMTYMHVMVTAIQEGNKSEGIPSNSFSFNDLKVVDTKCK